MSFIQDNWAVIIAGLLGLSEVLALIPAIKSNSVFQLVYNGLKKFKKKAQDVAEQLPETEKEEES